MSSRAAGLIGCQGADPVARAALRAIALLVVAGHLATLAVPCIPAAVAVHGSAHAVQDSGPAGAVAHGAHARPSPLDAAGAAAGRHQPAAAGLGRARALSLDAESHHAGTAHAGHSDGADAGGAPSDTGCSSSASLLAACTCGCDARPRAGGPSTAPGWALLPSTPTLVEPLDCLPHPSEILVLHEAPPRAIEAVPIAVAA